MRVFARLVIMLRNVLLLWLLLSGFTAPAMSEPLAGQKGAASGFELEEIAQGLGIPWGMVFIGPEELLFTERQGSVGLLNVNTGVVTALSGVPPVMASGQAGMLDVAVPADYKSGDWIYFTYVKEQGDQGVSSLARAKLQGHRLLDWQTILDSKSASATSQHFGSRIAFDEAGHVFFGIGDRGVRPNAQNLTNHAGTVIRLNRDGSVPGDNPFIDHPGALAEIWSYGHRNPQGIAYDKNNQRLWLIEHGPRGGDELNLILAGRNYGWPVISYGKEYWGPLAVGEGTEKAGMEQPVKYYVPSIAPGSLILYSGKAFPQWRGNLFAGSLVLRHLNRIVLDDAGRAVAEERLLESFNERVRALTESPQGWLYLSTDSGMILRIRPAAKK